MYTWFTQDGTRGTPLSGPIVMAKALSFAKKFMVKTTYSKFPRAGWINLKLGMALDSWM